MNVANAPDCPWCGEKMRFDADSVHCWFKCDNCLAASPKALRAWDVAKSTKDNWADTDSTHTIAKMASRLGNVIKLVPLFKG